MHLPLNKYPKLDVHGETRDTVYTVIKEFIQDSIKLKKATIIIVHGGQGNNVLKEEVHYILKHMKEVKSFHLDYWNRGVTVVELRI